MDEDGWQVTPDLRFIPRTIGPGKIIQLVHPDGRSEWRLLPIEENP